MIALRVALLVGPLVFAVLTLQLATRYRTSAPGDYRAEEPSGDLPRD